jgi:hypothetical protein
MSVVLSLIRPASEDRTFRVARLAFGLASALP